MAVWPFCLPWPRTSVTVMPEMLIFSSASRTSSTLFGRTIALINFIIALQHALQIGRVRLLRRIRQLGALRREMEDVQYEGLGARHGVALQNVQAERRQHAADIREQVRLAEGDDRQLPRGALALERRVDVVRLDVGPQRHVAVDRLALEHLPV